jgi:hypothetical protein
MLFVNGRTVKEEPFPTMHNAVKRWIDDPIFYSEMNCNQTVIRLPDNSCWLPPYPGSDFRVRQELATLILAHWLSDFEPGTLRAGLSKCHTIFMNIVTLEACRVFCVVCGYIDLTAPGRSVNESLRPVNRPLRANQLRI